MVCVYCGFLQFPPSALTDDFINCNNCVHRWCRRYTPIQCHCRKPEREEGRARYFYPTQNRLTVPTKIMLHSVSQLPKMVSCLIVQKGPK